MAKKVLLIDDEPELVKMIKSRLEAHQYSVVTAPNGVLGLKLVESEAPDVILLDIMMPEMDGYTFTKELKSKHLNHVPPVIVLTARSEMKDLFEIEGVADYMVKPFRAEDLLEKIKAVSRWKNCCKN